MKHILTILILLISFNTNAQFLKEIYNDFLKYGTFYAAGNIENAQLVKPNYFIRTNPDDFYGIPEVDDRSIKHPFNYRYGFGIRKLARFDYEVKPGTFWTGNQKLEKQIALSAPTSAVKGLEYLLHWEKERHNGSEFDNKRLFVRHTGKYHIAKFEARETGKIDFEYISGELRARLPIGKKFSLSAGAIYRTHQRPYGYNPVEIWLNEKDDQGNALNPWYSLGFEYGYDDIFYQSTDEFGNSIYDWYWINSNGDIVAHTDQQFRDLIMPGLLNRYNEEAWSELDSFGEIAPIVGVDFYHYKSNFWLHAYGNWILPYHKYIKGDVGYSYLHRNGWDHEGHHDGHSATNGDQWSDYQAGLVFGVKVSKAIGLFIEGEYTKFWESEMFNSNFGINFTFR
jgi:hypothetical protein